MYALRVRMSKTALIAPVRDVDQSAKGVSISSVGASPRTGIEREAFGDLQQPKGKILVDPAHPHQEGRGVYDVVGERILYTKGAGCSASFGSGLDEWRRFPMFGNADVARYLRGAPPEGRTTPPGVWGALSWPHAIAETENAWAFLKTIMKVEGISTMEEARAKGLTIPRNPEVMTEVSAEICEAVGRVTGASSRSRRNEDTPEHLYGLAVLEVPSHERLRPRSELPLSKNELWSALFSSPDKMIQVSKVMHRQLQCGFVTVSIHYQNIYDASHSICPHADNVDLVPISEALREAPRILREAGQQPLSTSEMQLALVMRQCLYLPFNVLRYLERPKICRLAEGAIFTMLNALEPDKWSEAQCKQLTKDFMDKPFTVLSDVAQRIEVNTDALVNWGDIWNSYSGTGYREISRQMLEVAVTKAASFYRGLQTAEKTGGLKPLEV